MESMNISPRRNTLYTLTLLDIEQAWAEFFVESVRGAPGAVVRQEPWATWGMTPSHLPPFNLITSLRLDDDVDARLDLVLAGYRTRALPFMWMVTPDSRSRPTDLGARLSERGLKHPGETPTMTLALSYLDARNAQVADLEIEQVRDLATFRTWMDVFGVGYGVPPSEGRTLFDLWTQSDKSFTDPTCAFTWGGWTASRWSPRRSRWGRGVRASGQSAPCPKRGDGASAAPSRWPRTRATTWPCSARPRWGCRCTNA